MKKKLAALLCSVMCVGAFTGCSDTELAYLKMSKDMLDTMETCKVTGSMRADVDFDAMEAFMTDVANATITEMGMSLALDGEEMLVGRKAVTVDYDMNMNLGKLEYDMAFDVTYEGRKYDLGTMYYSLSNGIYVTSDTLWGAYQMMGDVVKGEDESYLFTDAFAKDLKAVLARNPYIELVSMEGMTGVDMEEAVPEEGMSSLYDAAITFYQDVLDGFETGMVKEIPGGFAIQADGREVAQLLVDLLDFVAQNPEQIINATETYMNAVMDNIELGTPEETEAAKAQMTELFEMARASQDDFVAAAADMKYMLAGIIQEESVAAILDSFSYEADVKKDGNGFVSNAVYDVTNKGKQVLRLSTNSKIVKSTAAISMPENGISLDDLTAKLQALENKYNPVIGVTMNWGWDGINDEADLYKMRAEDGIFGNDYAFTDLIVKDGRAYLPLRVICDALGETVGWENATKTPYVLQDGKRIDMKGMLQDGRAFVGVRDFEKLGYTVSYTSYAEGYKEAVIAK